MNASNVTHALSAHVDAGATGVVVAVAADHGLSDAVWRSEQVWADSGFLAFLAAHEIKRSDLLSDSNSSVTTDRRFFRYERACIAGTASLH